LHAHKGAKTSPKNGQSPINKDSSNPNLFTRFEANAAIKFDRISFFENWKIMF
jgi:hypothetical protein